MLSVLTFLLLYFIPRWHLGFLAFVIFALVCGALYVALSNRHFRAIKNSPIGYEDMIL